jgi:hypothetical protein
MIMPAEKNFWLVHQSSLTILPAVICEQVMDEMNENFYLVSISFTLASDFLHAVTSYDMGLPSLLSIRRNVCCGFLSPLKIHRLSRIWTRDLRYSGKHTNPYTTEETIWNPNWTSVLKSLSDSRGRYCCCFFFCQKGLLTKQDKQLLSNANVETIGNTEIM